jgi:hypothetical protein
MAETRPHHYLAPDLAAIAQQMRLTRTSTQELSTITIHRQFSRPGERERGNIKSKMAFLDGHVAVKANAPATLGCRVISSYWKGWLFGPFERKTTETAFRYRTALLCSIKCFEILVIESSLHFSLVGNAKQFVKRVCGS